MSWTFLVLLAMGLAMDALAVAIACSIALRQVNRRQVFRFAFHFGLFQAAMPVFGWSVGSAAHEHVAAWDHWLAFGLLFFVGLKALNGAFRDDDKSKSETTPESAPDPTRGWSLVILSIATSIDAFAVGLSLAMLESHIWTAAAFIGLITAALTTLGMALGSRLGERFGHRMEIAGGLVLIGIGFKILVSHHFPELGI